MENKKKPSDSIEELTASEEEEHMPKEALVTLSTGVVLKCKSAPPAALLSVMTRFPRPEPPEYYVETLKRAIPNPDDPDYIERVSAWKTKYSEALSNALILLGTEPKELPKGFPKHDSKEFINILRTLGEEVQEDNNDWLYLKWVVYKAAATAEDYLNIQTEVGRLSGVAETDVEAAAQFPGGN